MPYSLVLERASGTHKNSVQRGPSLLTSTCSVVCLLPQAYSNKFRLAALEAPCFILFGALERSGKEWSYIYMKCVNILWTGGWDSTFRIVELSLKEVTVQPIYCVTKRHNSDKEINAMKDILLELRKRPQTKATIKDVELVDINSIPSNQEITSAYGRISRKVKLGSQYEWLSRLSTLYPMIEIGIEKPSGEYSGIVTAVKGDGDFIYDGDTYIVDKSISSDDINLVFGRMSFPIVDRTENEMLDNIKSIGYEDVMSKIWFCHEPIDGHPCGICRPCQQKMECNMKWLLPEKAQRRYRVFKLCTKMFGDKVGSKIVTKLFRRKSCKNA